MSKRPTYTKPDKNQAEIVKELRRLGFDVDVICDLPGLYDLVVSGRKDKYIVSVRVEIKSEKGLLNDNEIHYYELQRHPDSYIVAYNVEDVLQWFGQ